MIIETAPFIDIHVHLREPGQEHKETIATGTSAAVHGGFGAVCCMPNTLPSLDTEENVAYVLARAKQTARCAVYPIAAITKDRGGHCHTNFAALKAAGAVALSDDGSSVADESLMRQALIEAYKLNLPVISHCEPETETAERDIALAEETHTAVHIAHVSLKSTIDVIRSAKRRGVRVTAETCPHYFLQSAHGIMNPPLAKPEDISAVTEAVIDGTIDVIATDHAPHTAHEKAQTPPPFGVVGLETALAAALTAFYATGLLPLEKIFALMRDNPARILSLPLPKGVVTVDTDKEWVVTEQSLTSKSKNSPFNGVTLKGAVICSQLTV